MAYRIPYMHLILLKRIDYTEVRVVDFSNESRNAQIGIYLKTLREEQDLTMEQLSVASQIPVTHLTAIEAGRFSKYDIFYLKLYLKKYTQVLDVDLEQLYTYATQQKAPEIPVAHEPKKVLTGMQADIATVAPKKEKEKTKPQVKPKTTIKTKGVVASNSKGRLGRVLIALFLILLVSAIVAVVVFALRNHDNQSQDDPFVPPPLFIDPPNINGNDDDDNYEEYEPEIIDLPEPVPTPEDLTVIEIEGSAGSIQTFIVTTALTEIELRIEHNGQNWIDIDNRIHDDIFEYLFEITGSAISFTVGAIHNIEAMYINDVAVPITTEDLIGRHTFIFNVITDADETTD